MKKILISIFFVVLTISLVSCGKNKESLVSSDKSKEFQLETGDKVSSITLSIDGESITINDDDNPIDTLEKLSNVSFIPTEKANEQKTFYKESYDRKNVYDYDKQMLVTEKTLEESEKILTYYLGVDTTERLNSYSYIVKKDEGKGLQTYLNENLKFNFKTEEIDSSSEYYLEKYNMKTQSINTIKYLYDNGKSKKSNEVTYNILDTETDEIAEATNYLYYTESDVSMYFTSNPLNGIDTLKRITSNYLDYCDINIHLTKKYLIVERTIKCSSNAIESFENGATIDESIKKSKDNGDSSYLLAYYDYNNIENRRIVADYYECKENFNQLSSGVYTADMHVPSEYVGTKYSINYKSSQSFILTIKEFSDENIEIFKESIKL